MYIYIYIIIIFTFFNAGGKKKPLKQPKKDKGEVDEVRYSLYFKVRVTYFSFISTWESGLYTIIIILLCNQQTSLTNRLAQCSWLMFICFI